MTKLRFRAHHFLCTTAFEGKGYSPEFVKNYYQLLERLEATEGEECLIEVVAGTDSICEPCPHRNGKKCRDEPRILYLDAAHANVIGVKVGEQISWNEAKKRLGQRMTIEKFNEACRYCGWKALGVCETALRQLRHKYKKSCWAFVLFFTGLIHGHAYANPSLGMNLGTTEEPRFLDEITIELKTKKKHPVARQIKRAEEALASGHLARARNLADAIKRHSLFSDYGWYYAGQYQLAMAKKAFERRAYAQALRYADRSVERYLRITGSHPGSALLRKVPSLIARSEMFAVRALNKKRQYSQAIRYFERALERMPRRRLLTQISFVELQAYLEACKKKKGRVCGPWIRWLVKMYPSRSIEFKAIRRELPWSSELPDPVQRARRERRYKALDKDLTAIDEAMQAVLEKSRSAHDKLVEFLRTYPKSKYRFRALYWLARILEEKGERQRARDMYITVLSSSPYGYYALLSSLRSGRGLENYIDATIPQGMVRDPFLRPVEVQKVARAEHLIAESANQIAGWELESLPHRQEMSDYFLMYLVSLNSMVDGHLPAFKVLSELITRGHAGIYSTYGLSLIFPGSYQALVEKYATQRGMDALLIRSLMKQESAFLPDVVSWAGAAGLMQIMPETALDMDLDILQSKLIDPEHKRSFGNEVPEPCTQEV